MDFISPQRGSTHFQKSAESNMHSQLDGDEEETLLEGKLGGYEYETGEMNDFFQFVCPERLSLMPQHMKT